MKFLPAATLIISILLLNTHASFSQWIRINQLGYTPNGIKVAVYGSKEDEMVNEWQLINAENMQPVFSGKVDRYFGAYGPFKQSFRINFTAFGQPGNYFLRAGSAVSPPFRIDEDVYKGTADFVLQYMRQQRCGFNPFLKDSCHTQDGYSLYGKAAGLPDSTYIDAVGGWHDASDYLQYATTSANATYHLLMAYRDYPAVFADTKAANGLDGANKVPDVLDEAAWGVQWLLKMHPNANQLFNQVADDRDHIAMRMPGLDSQYGKKYQRPVYFIDGNPQQRGKFLNATTGTSSTAAKFSSVFSLASQQLMPFYKNLAQASWPKAQTALKYSEKKPGVTQTVSVRSPYIYAETNWTDDMELQYTAYATAQHSRKLSTQSMLDAAYVMAFKEPITPWLGADTAAHYQWYPFINIGHRELAKLLSDKNFAPELAGKKEVMRAQLVNWYRLGIDKVWGKAKHNAFYRGIPFIWCSNNLTTSFAIQCNWYRELSGDEQYAELEQANLDWLFGCNPWGTSMVYGLPSQGDSPSDPHSAFTHLKNYPINGGLVDGPVYSSIYNSLIGIKLNDADEYEAFQSDLAVYHDDYGDYSTNEPTMDGTASLVYLLAAAEAAGNKAIVTIEKPALATRVSAKKSNASTAVTTRGDSTQKNIALIFSAHDFGEGLPVIANTLKKSYAKGSFFFTGDFYRTPANSAMIASLVADGHYLGAHSDKHLLYADWNKRDSLLVSKELFKKDLLMNYIEMGKFGIDFKEAGYFLPPYEWYNDSIANWTKETGLQLINFTPGTLSNADYTWPELKNYRNSKTIYESIINFANKQTNGLNGFILLIHPGTDPRRKDKFYNYLPKLIIYLQTKGYGFRRIDEMLEE